MTVSLPATVMENALYGTELSGNPQKVYYMTVLPNGNNTLVQITEKISNPGTVYQKISDYYVDEPKYISVPNSIFNPRYTYGFGYYKHRKYLQMKHHLMN